MKYYVTYRDGDRDGIFSTKSDCADYYNIFPSNIYSQLDNRTIAIDKNLQIVEVEASDKEQAIQKAEEEIKDKYLWLLCKKLSVNRMRLDQDTRDRIIQMLRKGVAVL